MKKVLLADFCSFKGHHEIYFMKVLSTLINNGYYVFSYSVDNLKLKENICSQNLQNCQVIDLRLSAGDKLTRHLLLLLDSIAQALPFQAYLRPSSLCNLIATNRLISQIGEQIPVFFAHTDSILPAVPPFIANKFMPDAWSGIYIQPSYRSSIYLGHFKSRQRFFAEKNLTLASCKSLLVLDSIYQTFFKKTYPELKCLYLPELCLNETPNKLNSTSDIVRTIKDKAFGRNIISVLGALTRRKNLLLFLESVIKLDSEKYFPVIVGQLYRHEYSWKELEKISELTQNLKEVAFIELDYHIPNETEFDSLICLSDIVYIQYQNHPFSSNILIRAIMHRKPVIVSPGYLMEKTVNQYRWQTVAGESCDEIVDAIQCYTENFKIYEEYHKKFESDYSEEKFDISLLKGMKYLNTNYKKVTKLVTTN